MATANYANPDPVNGLTGSFVRARFRWPNGTTGGETPLNERQTPKPEGAFFFPVPCSFTLQDGALSTDEYTVEVRQTPTQDSAGFDSSASVLLAFGAFTVDSDGTISDGGSSASAAGTTTFRLKTGDGSGNLVDEPGLVSVIVAEPGIIAVGETVPVVAAGTAFTHTAVGIWTAPEPVTDAQSGLTYIAPLTKVFADTHTEDLQEVVQGSVSSGGAVEGAGTSTPQQTVTFTCYDAAGDTTSDAVIEYQVRVRSTSAGRSFPGAWRQTTSNNLGLVTLKLAVGETYWIRRDSGTPVIYTPASTNAATLTPAPLGLPQN